MTFESIYKKIFKKMQEQGKVTILSKEVTYRIDHQLAMGLAPIKEEFYKKQNTSRSYIHDLESKTVAV